MSLEFFKCVEREGTKISSGAVLGESAGRRASIFLNQQYLESLYIYSGSAPLQIPREVIPGETFGTGIPLFVQEAR